MMEIAKKLGGVQHHSHSLSDFNSTAETQPTARLGCIIKECGKPFWVLNGKNVTFCLRILSIQTKYIGSLGGAGALFCRIANS